MRQETLDQINNCVELANQILAANGFSKTFDKNPRPSIGSGYDIYLGSVDMTMGESSDEADVTFEILTDSKSEYGLVMKLDFRRLYDFRKRTVKPKSLEKAQESLAKVFDAAAKQRQIQDDEAAAKREKGTKVKAFVVEMENNPALKCLELTFNHDHTERLGSASINTPSGTSIVIEMTDGELSCRVRVGDKWLEKTGYGRVVNTIVRVCELEAL